MERSIARSGELGSNVDWIWWMSEEKSTNRPRTRYRRMSAVSTAVARWVLPVPGGPTNSSPAVWKPPSAATKPST